MDEESFGTPTRTQKAGDQPAHDSFRNLFLNKHGLRAGWRLAIFGALVLVLRSIPFFVLRDFLRPPRGVFSPRSLFLVEALSFCAVFVAAMIMARMENRPFGVYGLPTCGAFGKRFWQGCLLGLCEVSALIGLIAAFGRYSFGGLALHGGTIARWALFWLVFFIVVGLFEEFLFRGYVQYTLADGIGFWPAAVLLSAGFGWVHLGNPGEGLVGAASVVMCGLLFALPLRRTGNLWFTVGMHASFDFGETFLYSVPNSGIILDGHLSNATLHGAAWLTGGTVGPEGSVFSFLLMAILALVIHLLFPAKRSETEKFLPA